MPRRTAFEALTLVDEGGLLARDALEAVQARRRLEPRDRDLASELVQGVIRREVSLDAVLSLRLKRPIEKLDERVHRILRIGAYQILFLDRVPHAAAVTTSVELARAVGREGTTGLVNAVLRAVAALVAAPEAAAPAAAAAPGAPSASDAAPRRTLPRGDGTVLRLAEDAFPDPAKDLAGNLAARWSVPRWAVLRFVAQRGEAGARQILAASIAWPPVSLRPRRGRQADVERALAAAGVAFEHEGPCLLLRGAGDVRKLPLWDEGAFVVQDATAAEVAGALAPVEGASVLDVCAAPGGKTLALAEAVGPSGRVAAVDVPGPRSMKMMTELARRGAGNVAVFTVDGTDAAALPIGPAGPSAAPGFDAVLVDAPCSNSGVLTKRVEARWRLTDGDALASLVPLQTKLLEAAATRVRAGGRLAWSTCSVDDDENSVRVRAFLAAHPEFSLVSERLTLPVAGRRDGGYVAVMVRARGATADPAAHPAAHSTAAPDPA